jgi:hypothetical protein
MKTTVFVWMLAVFHGAAQIQLKGKKTSWLNGSGMQYVDRGTSTST